LLALRGLLLAWCKCLRCPTLHAQTGPCRCTGMRRIHQTCILMPMTVKVRLSCLPCLTGMAAALQTRSFGRSGGCALQLVGLRAVSLHFKAHLDRLIIMAALLMLSPLCHHFCSFLLAPSLHPYPFRVSSCCYLNNLQRPCHCLLVLQAVATMRTRMDPSHKTDLTHTTSPV